MKTIFEQGALGHGLSLLPACDVPVVTLAPARKKPLHLRIRLYFWSLTHI